MSHRSKRIDRFLPRRAFRVMHVPWHEGDLEIFTLPIVHNICTAEPARVPTTPDQEIIISPFSLLEN